VRRPELANVSAVDNEDDEDFEEEREREREERVAASTERRHAGREDAQVVCEHGEADEGDGEQVGYAALEDVLGGLGGAWG